MQPFNSERLYYRPFRRGDAAAAFAFFGDREVMKYSAYGVHETVEHTAGALANLIEMNRQHGYGLWAVIERATGELIGMAGLAKFDADGVPELAYRLRRDRWGREYGTEAACAWVEAGFSTLGLSQIVAFVEPDHTVSRRILEKAGLRFAEQRTYRGQLVDCMVMERPDAA